VFTSGEKAVKARSAMAYGSLLSGITLANAGLGIVHGIASPIGGFFEIPHGVVCGSIVSAATQINIINLKKIDNFISNKALHKYAEVGGLLNNMKYENLDSAHNSLLNTLHEWTDKLNLPSLSELGIKQSHLDKIIQNTGIKNNPVKLSQEEIRKILLARMVV
jgi:alcohol dehydrogenase